MRVSYYTKLSGTSFRQDTIKKLEHNSSLRAIARPDNEYDSNAVEIQALTKDGWEQIGWIQKDKNYEISKYLQEGTGPVQITLSEVTGGSVERPTLGVNVGIVYGEDEALEASKLSKLTKQMVAYGDAPFILFDEEGHHAYDLDGHELLSGSRFEANLAGEPNLSYAAKAIAKKSGLLQQDVEDIWNTKRVLAAEFGTIAHKAMEMTLTYINQIRAICIDDEIDYGKLLPQPLAFIANRLPDKIIASAEKGRAETEVRIKWERLTGIADLIVWEDNDKFHLYDYKFTHEIKDVKYNGVRVKKYTAQQNFYRYIIEHATGKKCTGMTLLVCDLDESVNSEMYAKWTEEPVQKMDIEEFL